MPTYLASEAWLMLRSSRGSLILLRVSAPVFAAVAAYSQWPTSS
jgi:hypothetical protein